MDGQTNQGFDTDEQYSNAVDNNNVVGSVSSSNYSKPPGKCGYGR